MCVQSKGDHRGRKLVACFYEQNRVGIQQLGSGDQKLLEIKESIQCAAIQHILAVTTVEDSLHLFTHDGDLVHVVPGSTQASSVAFHPRNPNVLAMGDEDGTVHMGCVHANLCFVIQSAFQPNHQCSIRARLSTVPVLVGQDCIYCGT